MKVWLVAACALFAAPAFAQDARPSDRYDTCRAAEDADARLSGICATVDDLYEAVDLYDEARHGPQFAEIHYLLGSALYALGYSGDGPALRDSIAASQASLRHYGQGRTPTRWGAVQLNIANAYFALHNAGEVSAADNAVTAIQASLTAIQRSRQPELWATAQRMLGDGYFIQGQRSQDQAKLNQALEAYRASLEIYRRARYAEQRARVEGRVAEVLEALGASAPSPS